MQGESIHERGPGTALSRRSVLLTSVSALLFSACGGRPAPTTYDLSAPRDGLGRLRSGATLIVTEPTALFALDSERMVVRSANGELAYLPAAQWSDRMPRLLQTRIIQTFENRGRVSVGRPGDRLLGAYQLIVDVRAFEVRESDRTAQVELAAKLVSAAGGQVVASRLFGGQGPVSAIDGAGMAQAMEGVLARVLVDLTGWASASI